MTEAAVPPAVAAARSAVLELRKRIGRADDAALDLLFREARTHNGWSDRPVTDDDLRRLHAVMKFGPTSTNCNPARFHFLRSKEAKAKLLPTLNPGNVPKVEGAPVTCIVAYDTRFFEHLPRLFPHRPDAGDRFKVNAAAAETTAFRNGTLQGAYMIIAARAIGLDVGAMSGFDNAKVDAAFFAGTALKSNFLITLGYGNETALFERLPRFGFDEVCTLL